MREKVINIIYDFDPETLKASSTLIQIPRLNSEV